MGDRKDGPMSKRSGDREDGPEIQNKGDRKDGPEGGFMGIPTAVKQQADLADEMLRSLAPQNENEKEEVAEETKQPVVEEKVADEEKDYKGEYERLLGEYNTLKNKYDTLRGKYDAEVGRLIGEIDKLSAELANTKIEIAETKKAITEKTQTETFSKEDEEFKETYPDIYNYLSKSLRKEIQSAIEGLKQEFMPKISDAEKRIEKTDAETKWLIFRRELTDLVPDWEEINVDPGFVEYLQEHDKYSGLKKMDLLKAANARYDAKTVSVFFEEYKNRKQNTQKPPATSENISPPQPSLGAQSQENKTQKGGKTFSRAFIRQFYRDVALGKYPKEVAEKIKMDIDKALLAGNITD